jgi:chain length determinant protein EpsF
MLISYLRHHNKVQLNFFTMDVQQFFQTFWARMWIIVLSLMVTVVTAAILTKLMPYSYTASTALIVDFREINPLSSSDIPVQLSTSYMTTQIDILKSERVASKVVELLKLDQNPVAREEFMQATEGKGTVRSWLAGVLLKEVDVEPSRDSRMITIKYSNPDPRFAALVANTFAKAYMETNLALRIDPARLTGEWFDEQMKTLRAYVTKAHSRLTDYQRTHGIIGTDERLDAETLRLNDLTSQMARMQVETADLEGRQKQMENAIRGGGDINSLPEVIQNNFIQSLKAEIVKQQSKLVELSEQYGANHPAYTRAQAELNNLRNKQKEELSNFAKGIANNAQLAQERMRSLEAAITAQKAKLLDIKRERDELNVLNREVENAQRIFDAAQERYQLLILEGQTNQTNIAVLTEAVEPVEPARPKVIQNMVLSVFLGLMLGVGLALVLEVVDRRVRSERDLVDALGLPLLGAVPMYRPLAA